MKAHEALTKIRVMLGMEPEVVAESIALAEATLVDGTKVMVEGELVEGNILLVEVADGEPVPAPAGVHETTDGLLVTVDENGVIASVEQKPEEEVEVELEAEEEILAPETIPFGEDFLSKIAGLISPLNERLNAIEAKFSELDNDFHQFRDQPAAGRVKNNLVNSTDSMKNHSEMKELRMNKLLELRKQK